MAAERQVCIKCGIDKTKYARGLCQTCHRRMTATGNIERYQSACLNRADARIARAKERAERLTDTSC